MANKKKSKTKNKIKNKNTGKKESKSAKNNKNRDESRKIAAQNFTKFSEQVGNLGLRIKEVGGDGNCLFRSFADQIEGNEGNHQLYRKTAVQYISDNQDHFKNFIEDDKTIAAYIKEMSKDSTWGGNLEIQALSKHFNVNFFIQIYNHPMYIVSNTKTPTRNIHLSYHDGEHYNSIRLKEDLAEDIPLTIPLELINCVEQTTNAEVINENKIDEDNEEENDEKEDNENDQNDNEDSNSYTNNFEGIVIENVSIKDNKEKTQKFLKSLLTSNGKILNEINDHKKCHCDSNKKYKSCCADKDVRGEYNKSENIFYCDLEIFKLKIKQECLQIGKIEDSVNTVTKKLDKIFI